MATAAPPRIDRATFTFLADLESHNERDWFLANKDRYLAAQANVQVFADALIERMKRHDRIATDSGKEALQRIYTDQRFHKDRPPYNPRFSGGLGRVKPALRGGYFFRFQPGGRSHITCGFMGPEAADLKRIRTDIAQDPKTWQRLLNAKAISTNFGTLQGEQLKTTPKGFDANHQAIDLLRYKQFLLIKKFTDEEVLSADFVKLANQTFKNMRPFLDYMSEVLTTNINGEVV